MREPQNPCQTCIVGPCCSLKNSSFNPHSPYVKDEDVCIKQFHYREKVWFWESTNDCRQRLFQRGQRGRLRKIRDNTVV